MNKKSNIEVEGLDNIGLERDVMVNSIVTEQAQLLINTIRQVMEDEKITASYALAQSIEPRVYVDGFDVVMDDYWKYVNEGVKGVKAGTSYSNYSYKKKRPPIADIIRWESFKKTGKNVYALREVIFQKGIRPRLFVDKAIELFNRKKS